MAGRALTIDINTRDQQTLAALKRIQRELGQLDKSLDTTAQQTDQVSRSADDAAQKFGQMRERAGQITFGVTVAALGGATVAAGNLAEAQARANAVFGEGVEAVNEFAEGATDSLGISRREALETTSDFGNLFTQLGLGSGKAAEMSKAMVTLGADFAAFRNANPVDVMEAQAAAFRGEYDALQRYIPTINAAAVQQRALADTGKANASQLTELEKAQATYNIMLENAGDAAGAAAREADGLAGSTRRAKAEIENAGAELGENLAPAVAKGAQGVAWMAGAFSQLPGPLQTGIVGVGGMAAATALLAPRIRETVDAVSAGISKVRSFGSETATAGQKMAAAATGAAALSGAVVAGVAAWHQWGAEGRAAAEEQVSRFDQANGRTVEGLRQTAEEARALADGVKEAGGWFDGWPDPGDIFDIDADRAISEGRKAAQGQAEEFDQAADRIEEVASRTGMSLEEVEEAMSHLGLDPMISSTDKLVAALQENRDVTDQVTGRTEDMADAQDRAADAIDRNRQAAESARSALDGLRSAEDAVTSAQESAQGARDAVADAEEGLADARDAVRDAARGVEDAERGLADAREAQQDALADLAEAERQAREGSEELEDAHRGVIDAERELADAQRKSLQAQEDLNAAREEAADRLVDLEVGARKAVLDEQDAILDLKEARRQLAEGPRLQEARRDETDEQRAEREKRNAEARAEWARQRERLELRVARAEIAVEEATRNNAEAQEELAEANDRGIEKSPEVVAAKEAIVEAAEAEREAEEGLSDARKRVVEVQEELAARVVEAQARVEEANGRVRDAADRVRDAHDQVHEAQQRVNEQASAVVEARGAVEEAERNLTSALAEQLVAQDELNRRVRESEGAFDAQKQKLIELAAELEPGSPVRQHLLEMAGELNALSSRPWNIDVVLRLQTGELQVGRDLSLAAAEQAMGGRAFGGAIGPGQRRVVGERGREILEMGPTTSGRLHTEEQWSSEERRREAAFAVRAQRRAMRAAGQSPLNARDIQIVQHFHEMSDPRRTARDAATQVMDALAGMVP